MHGMPHKGGSRSPEEENDGAQTELAGASLFAPNGTRWPGPATKHLVMRAPVNEVRQSGSGQPSIGNRFRPRKNSIAWARAYSQQHARLAFVYRPARL
jgi:hypothetical protein